MTHHSDDARHYRSFVSKERAEAWAAKVKETNGTSDVRIEDRLRTSIDYNVVMEEALKADNIPAVIEIDHERGVIWIHDATQGITAIRLCGLKGATELPLDITLVGATSYIAQPAQLNEEQ